MQERRIHGITLLKQGILQVDVAAICGVHRMAVQQWASALRKGTDIQYPRKCACARRTLNLLVQTPLTHRERRACAAKKVIVRSKHEGRRHHYSDSAQFQGIRFDVN